MAVEEIKYEIVKKHDAFELRRYAPYLIAETEVSGTFGNAGNLAFRTLAGFIDGQNRKREKIAMTAPVNQQMAEPENEKIAMTAPVTQTPGQATQSTYVIGFVMPAKFTLETLPEPTNPRVEIRSVPSKLMAVHKYSGSWSKDNYRKHESILLKAVEKAGFNIVGEPIFARYNAPFVPWFVRRNEVMIEVEDQSKNDTSSNNQAQELMKNEAVRKRPMARHVLGRIGKPEDVASAIAWLLDPKQSWVTEQVIGVDGGLAIFQAKQKYKFSERKKTKISPIFVLLRLCRNQWFNYGGFLLSLCNNKFIDAATDRLNIGGTIINLETNP